MRYLLLVALATLTSCKSVQFGGNPDPNMKTVHMMTVHWSYTQEDYDQHPDEDCKRTYVLIKDR